MSSQTATDPLPAAPAMHVVATAGHVDHGKSALLKALTGQEPDRWDEERRRGLTIDLGYVWTTLAGANDEADPVTVAFVDVPGHDGFLANMLSGVGVVERALFVVAADDGWSAQSEEHLEILDLLGRRGLVAVVTKADVAGPDRAAEVVADVAQRLERTSLAGTPVLAVDSLSGAGLDELRATLAERLRAMAAALPGDDAVAGSRAAPGGREAPGDGTVGARLWVDRSFTVTGAGTVVTGLLIAGRLAVGDEVVLEPAGRRARVRGLQCLEEPVRSVAATARAAINLAGVDADAVERGDVVTTGTSVAPTTAVDVHLRALTHEAIGRTGAWHLHVGTAATTVRIRPLLGDIDAGSEGQARLELDHPLPLRVGDRFVLREAGRRLTLGGGIVLDPQPRARRPRGAEARLAHAMVLDELREAIAGGDRADQAAALVAAHGGSRDRAQLQALLATGQTRDVSAGPTSEGDAEPGPSAAPRDVRPPDEVIDAHPELTAIGELVVASDQVAPWTQAILTAGREAPADHAVERATLAAAAAAHGCPRELAPALIDRAVADGALRSYGGRVVHPDHEARYLAARATRVDALLALLDDDPWQPPDATDALRSVGLPSFELQTLLDEGRVVAAGSLLFPAEHVSRAVAQLREGPGRDGASFTAAEARDAWGCTRRAAMPLLEHLRAVGVTRFDGERHRLVGP